MKHHRRSSFLDLLCWVFRKSSRLSPLLRLNQTQHKKSQTRRLTGMSTAEDPGMVGLGRVPGIEAGIGCLCRLCRCSSEDREPGTGLGEEKRKESCHGLWRPKQALPCQPLVGTGSSRQAGADKPIQDLSFPA